MTGRTVFGRMFLMSAAALGALAYPATATAQEATPGAEDSNEEIVVTATRRAESLQDVPVAVTAITGDALEDSGFRSIQDIQNLAPSVQFGTNSNGSGFQIRGVGTQGFDYTLDQSVGIMIDGVVQGIPRDPGISSLTDISQIEILRGPQGMLFGRNSSAGLVNITTRRPEMGVWNADGHVSYGTDNERVVHGNFNVPLGDTLALRISGFDEHRDGFASNLLTGESLGETNSQGMRAKLLWQPTDNLDIYTIASYQETDNSNLFFTVRSVSGVPFPNTDYAADNAPFGIVFGPENEEVADNIPSSATRTNVSSITTTIDYRIGEYTLTSVTGYRQFEGTESYMTDSTPTNIIDTNLETGEADQFTQELRLASPDTGPLAYVVGLYYYNSSTDATQFTAGQFALLPVEFSIHGGTDELAARNRSYAVFGQGTLRLSDDLSFILGGRYTHDEVRTGYHLVANPLYPALRPPASTDITDSTTNDNFSFRTGLQYDFNDDVMGYVTYSTGYKGPAFANLAGDPQLVDPETSTHIEVGLKSQWFERRLTANVALFSQQYEDFQAQVYDTSLVPPGYRLGNAGELDTQGIEIELSARPTDELSLSAAVTYAEARFSDYFGPCYAGQPVSPTVGQDCYVDPDTGALGQDLDGAPLSGAPDLSFTLGANYQRPFANGMLLEVGANYSWKDDYFTTVPDRNTIIDAHGVLGAQIGFGPQDGRWRLGLFGRNLLDEHFVGAIIANPGDPNPALGFPQGTPYGYVNYPVVEARQTVGIRLDVRFGQ